MADETTTTWAELLREARGPLVEALKYKTVTLTEFRRDYNPRRWHGKQITVPIFTGPQQGGGTIAETAAINTPQVVDVEQAVITSATLTIPVSFSRQVMKQSMGDENSWAEAVPTKMQRAEDVVGRLANEMLLGNSDALIAAATATNNNSTTVTVGTTANFYQLYPQRIVDVLTRSTGVAVTSGAGRKITAYDETAGTITVDVAITTTNTEGVYIQGSYGTAIQGMTAALATTGVFEGLNKANIDMWKGTDASPAAASDPSITQLDRAERRVFQRSGSTPRFFLSDPAVVDKYSQGLTVQARWAGEEGQLESGWTGVRYRNKLLIPEFDMPPSAIYGVGPVEDAAIYTLDEGPDWDDITGSVFQRFSTRSLTVEAWLVWMLNVGYHRCNSFVKVTNMNRAT